MINIYVVELDEYILLINYPIDELTCVFSLYKFNDLGEAYEAADQIANEQNKLVINAIDINNPNLYDPKTLQNKLNELMSTLCFEHLKVQEAKQT